MELIVEDLLIERGGRHIAGPLSFRVTSGEALLVTGPNGAGKTSLLKSLAGFLPAARGTVELTDDRNGGGPRVERCHHLGHENAVKGRLTVRENAAFWAAYLGSPFNRAEAAIERLGLGLLPHFPAAYLSAGQRRRLALARLLVADRRLWLLDEPTASLDAEGAHTLRALVADHLRAGGVAVVATHVPFDVPNARELRL